MWQTKVRCCCHPVVTGQVLGSLHEIPIYALWGAGRLELDGGWDSPDAPRQRDRDISPVEAHAGIGLAGP